MSFLDSSMFQNTYEPKSLAEGEYQLRILNLEMKDSQKTGGKFIQATFEIVNEPEAKNVYHVMMLPTANDDEKKKNGRTRAIIAFAAAFGVDVTKEGLKPEAMIGNMGWAILREEDDPEYGTKNSVKKFVIPKA